MARVDFEEIWGRNIFSYGEFRLPIRPGKHLIIGENGAGKSSLMETLVWAAYKVSHRDRVDRDGAGKCVGGFRVKVGQKRYEVERHLDGKDLGNRVELKVEGEAVQGRLQATTDTEIARILQYPYDLFTSTVVVLQGLPTNCAAMTPTTRKGLFEAMMGFAVWDEFKDLFEAAREDARKAHGGYALDIGEKQRIIAGHQARVGALRQALTARQQDLTTHVTRLKDNLRGVMAELQAAADEGRRLVGDRTPQQVQGEYADVQRRLYEAENQLKTLERIATTAACPTCSRPYPEDQLASAKEETHLAREQAAALRATYQEVSGLMQAFSQAQTRLAAADRQRQTIEGELRAVTQAKAAQAQQADDPTAEICTLESEVASIGKVVEALQLDAQDLATQIEHADHVYKGLLPSSGFRTGVLVDKLGQVNKLLATTGEMLLGGGMAVTLAPTATGKVSGIDVGIMRRGRRITYKSLSGGERRRLDISLILAFQRFLIENSGMSSNLLVFDEIFDGLDRVGINKVLGAIDSLFPESNAVYVITHNEAIKSVFSSVVRVRKEESISIVQGYETTHQ